MLIPVVLSGGAGSRLWPVSREGRPKPFMQLADGQSLLLKTYLRAAGVALSNDHDGELITVTNREYYFMSKDELMKARLDSRHQGVFILEPMARNTAAAVVMAALHVQERHGRDALLLVLAADHLIADKAAFDKVVADGAALARLDKLVTFGIVPSAPETGFGYIEAGGVFSEGRLVKRFVEKPPLDKAQEYLATGNYFWNAGMFCFKAGVLLDEFSALAPEVLEACRVCWQEMKLSAASGNSQEIPTELFSAVPDISVDYAIMERSSRVVVVPADIGWSDIGSWNAIRDLIPADVNSNRAAGEAIFVDSANTFVQSEDRLVAAVGIDNLMIIDTPDALLVAHSDKAQEVKRVVAQLKSRDHEAYRQHRTVARPWGTYTVLEEGPCFKIKRIEVKPGGSLSLQMHHHRSEHWIVVSGMAKVINGDQEIFVSTNQSTYIPAGHKHRLENPGVLDLVMIEVQSGEYLGEDDIVRFEDEYGRC